MHTTTRIQFKVYHFFSALERKWQHIKMIVHKHDTAHWVTSQKFVQDAWNGLVLWHDCMCLTSKILDPLLDICQCVTCNCSCLEVQQRSVKYHWYCWDYESHEKTGKKELNKHFGFAPYFIRIMSMQPTFGVHNLQIMCSKIWRLAIWICAIHYIFIICPKALTLWHIYILLNWFSVGYLLSILPNTNLAWNWQSIEHSLVSKCSRYKAQCTL